MRNAGAFLVIASVLAGCARSLPQEPAPLGALAIVPSRYEPAAQLEGGHGSIAEGAVIGAAGGAGIGAMSAKASAGLVCTIGGPLCWIVMIPAAIVGGLIGGIAGGVVEAITTDPGNRIAEARGRIEQAVADLRLTDAVAAKTYERAKAGTPAPVSFGGEADYTLEVGVSELEILARETEMALALRARSRLYRAADGALVDERISEAQTGFRKYEEWAADEARPLRLAVDTALAQLAESIVGQHLSPR